MKSACALAVAAGTLLFADDSIPDMLEKAMPAVVTVAVRKSAQGVEVKGLVATDAAYEKILDLGDAESSGSGFVIELSGKKYIVTNAHVVQTASGSGSLLVYSINQSKYEASVAALDSLYDLAVLTFDEPPGSEVTALRFRSGKVRVGEPVYAIGNPLGNYPYSVSSGIIGGKNRRFPDLTGKFGYLQSSAALSRGNSGGPLLGADGEVVGVDTRIGIDVQGRQSFPQAQLNFALEAGLASRIIGEMLANGGRLQRAYLGIEVTQDVNPNSRSASEGEVTLASVLPGSPAAQALDGKAGFTIRKIGRIEVHKADDALQALEEVKPGDPVRIEMSAPKSDKVDVVTLKAGSLTDENAAAIGTFLLKKEVAASMLEKDGSVILRAGAPTHPGANVSMRLKIVNLPRKSNPSSSNWLAKPVTHLPPELQIVAAGRLNSEDEDLYRVKNLRDLGIAVKLTALSGKMDFVYAGKDQGEPGLIQLTFSGQPDVIRRTLFY
jgi:S1-C subfamily serine protease